METKGCFIKVADFFYRIKTYSFHMGLETILISALQYAAREHDELGARGLELVQRNQHNEMAMLCDIKAEETVLNRFRQAAVPIRFFTEEHGVVDLTPAEKILYTGVLDGLDGSRVYRNERGTGRYGTMLSVFDGIDPAYNDYLASGIIEHATKSIFCAEKGKGSMVRLNGFKMPLKVSAERRLDENTRIYIDDFWEINRKTFAEKLRGSTG